MLTHPTLNQLRALKLDGMADVFVELQSQPPTSRMRNGWRSCSIGRRPIATPGASKSVCAAPGSAMAKRSSRTSITERRDDLISHCSSNSRPANGLPSIAICSLPARVELASRGYPTRSHRRLAGTATRCFTPACPRLFSDLELAHGDGRFARLFRTLVKTDLLVLDDWGPGRLTANQRRDLMEIVEDRHGRGSTLITSQLPLDKWHDIIGEPTFADAILDRIVHNAYRLELDGPSMRKLKASEQMQADTRMSEKDAARGASAPVRKSAKAG